MSFTIQTFLKRIECLFGIEEYREIWKQFATYLTDLKQEVSKEIFSIVVFENNKIVLSDLWRIRHFPGSSIIVNGMDKELVESKKMCFKLLFDSDWVVI